MSINKVEKKSVHFKEIKFLKRGENIEFTINGFEWNVKIVGFLDIGHGIHDVVVREKHEHHSLLALLSEYDSNFYECGQEYIEVDFYDDED